MKVHFAISVAVSLVLQVFVHPTAEAHHISANAIPQMTVPFRTADTAVTDPYGWTGERTHKGIDFAHGIDRNFRVHASARGHVLTWAANTVPFQGYGEVIIVRHGRDEVTGGNESWYKASIYAHLQEETQRWGSNTEVHRGWYLARADNTGTSFGDHLHYELMVNEMDANSYIDPNPYFADYFAARGLGESRFCADWETVCTYRTHTHIDRYANMPSIGSLYVNTSWENDGFDAEHSPARFGMEHAVDYSLSTNGPFCTSTPGPELSRVDVGENGVPGVYGTDADLHYLRMAGCGQASYSYVYFKLFPEWEISLVLHPGQKLRWHQRNYQQAKMGPDAHIVAGYWLRETAAKDQNNNSIHPSSRNDACNPGWCWFRVDLWSYLGQQTINTVHFARDSGPSGGNGQFRAYFDHLSIDW